MTKNTHKHLNPSPAFASTSPGRTPGGFGHDGSMHAKRVTAPALRGGFFFLRPDTIVVLTLAIGFLLFPSVVQAGLDTKVGTFSLQASTGNQAVTGVGFQPKVVLFMHGRDAATGLGALNASTLMGFGAATSSTQRAAWAVWNLDNTNVTVANRTFRTNRCLYAAKETAGVEDVDFSADFVSMDTDGFTVNVITADSATNVIGYIALGGSDITDAKVSQFDVQNSTGNHSVTGVGFQPDLLLFSGVGANSNDSWVVSQLNYIGYAISASEEAVSSASGLDNRINDTQEDRYQRSVRNIALSFNAAVNNEAEFVSMDADGFTYNNLTAPGTSQVGHMYIALKGTFEKKIHVWSDPTTAGSSSVTGIGFQPKAMIMSSIGGLAGTTVQSDSDWHLSFVQDSTARYHLNGQGDGEVIDSNTYRIIEQEFFKKYNAATTHALVSKTDFTSFDTDGFTVNRVTDDTFDRQFVSLLLGSEAQTFTWDGGGDGTTWTDANNWDHNSGSPSSNAHKAVINTGSSNITVPSGLTIGELDISGSYSGTVTLAGSLTIDGSGDQNGNLTLSSGTLDVSASNYSITLNGNWSNTGGTFTERQGTVTFNGSAAQTLTGETFYNLTINNSAASPGDSTDVDPSAAVTVTSTLTVTDGQFQPHTGSDFNGDVTIGAGGILKPNASAALTVAGNWSNSGTFTANSSTVTFDATDTGNTINPGSSSFATLTFNGAGGTWTLDAALDVNNDLTITAGTLDVNSTGNYGITVGGGWTDTGAGAFTERSGTVTFDGTGTINSNEAFHNVTLNTAGTITLGAALDVNGNLTITDGTLDTASGSNYAITLNGNWSNSDTFTARSGTVTLDGTSQTLTGSTTFNNLSKTVSSAATLTFPASTTTTVAGTLTLQGSASAFLKLRSSSDGTQWTINPQGSVSLQYLDVKDSNNQGSEIDATDSATFTDSGNNTGWNFNTAPVATALSSITQASDGSGSISFKTLVSDADSNTTRLKVEYSDNNGGDWYDPIITTATVSGGSVTVDNTATYQVSNLGTDSGNNIQVTIFWDTKSTNNGNGAVTGRQSDIKVRVTPNDSTVDGSVTASSAFTVDNQAPTGLADFSLATGTPPASNTLFASWTAASDAVFSHYEIWYGTTEEDVISRLTGRSAVEWDDSDDTDLALATTTSTTIPTVTPDGIYYVQLSALDSFGNRATLASATVTIDTVSPAFGSLADVATANTLPTLSILATDNVALGELKVKLEKVNTFLGIVTGYTAIETTTFSLSGISATTSFTPSNPLEAGATYRLTLTLKDSAGNTAEKQLTLSILTPKEEAELAVEELDAETTPLEEIIETLKETFPPSLLNIPDLFEQAAIRRDIQARLFDQFFELIPIQKLIAYLVYGQGRLHDALIATIDTTQALRQQGLDLGQRLAEGAIEVGQRLAEASGRALLALARDSRQLLAAAWQFIVDASTALALASTQQLNVAQHLIADAATRIRLTALEVIDTAQAALANAAQRVRLAVASVDVTAPFNRLADRIATATSVDRQAASQARKAITIPIQKIVAYLIYGQGRLHDALVVSIDTTQALWQQGIELGQRAATTADQAIIAAARLGRHRLAATWQLVTAATPFNRLAQLVSVVVFINTESAREARQEETSSLKALIASFTAPLNRLAQFVLTTPTINTQQARQAREEGTVSARTLTASIAYQIKAVRNILARSQEVRVRQGLENRQFIGEKIEELLIRPLANLTKKSILLAQYTRQLYFTDEPTRITNLRITQLAPTSAVVSWDTTHLTRRGKINYGTDPKKPWEDSAFEAEGIRAHHEVELSNLRAATTYYFEVMNQNGDFVYDAYYSLTTPSHDTGTVVGPFVPQVATIISDQPVLVYTEPLPEAQTITTVQPGEEYRALLFQQGLVSILLPTGQPGWVEQQYVEFKDQEGLQGETRKTGF